MDAGKGYLYPYLALSPPQFLLCLPCHVHAPLRKISFLYCLTGLPTLVYVAKDHPRGAAARTFPVLTGKGILVPAQPRRFLGRGMGRLPIPASGKGWRRGQDPGGLSTLLPPGSAGKTKRTNQSLNFMEV